MKKKIILLSLLVSGLMSAQVVIDTDTLKTTLDVSAKRNNLAQQNYLLLKQDLFNI